MWVLHGERGERKSQWEKGAQVTGREGSSSHGERRELKSWGEKGAQVRGAAGDTHSSDRKFTWKSSRESFFYNNMWVLHGREGNSCKSSLERWGLKLQLLLTFHYGEFSVAEFMKEPPPSFPPDTFTCFTLSLHLFGV